MRFLTAALATTATAVHLAGAAQALATNYLVSPTVVFLARKPARGTRPRAARCPCGPDRGWRWRFDFDAPVASAAAGGRRCDM